jgi:hypothetical protein
MDTHATFIQVHCLMMLCQLLRICKISDGWMDGWMDEYAALVE